VFVDERGLGSVIAVQNDALRIMFGDDPMQCITIDREDRKCATVADELVEPMLFKFQRAGVDIGNVWEQQFLILRHGLLGLSDSLGRIIDFDGADGMPIYNLRHGTRLIDCDNNFGVVTTDKNVILKAIDDENCRRSLITDEAVNKLLFAPARVVMSLRRGRGL